MCPRAFPAAPLLVHRHRIVVRADDDLAPRPVHDELVAGTDRGAQPPHADDEGDLERPHDDGRVRGLATALGRETDQAGPGQVQGVDGREEGADSDGGGSKGAPLQCCRKAEERPQEAIADRLHVRTPFPQVRILHASKGRGDAVDDPAHGALGGDLVLLDQPPRPLYDLIVPEHQAMSLEDEMPLVQVLGFESRREQRELLVSRSHCLTQPGDLGGHEVTRDPPVDDHHRGNEEARRPDCNAVGRSYTVEFSPCGHLRRTVAAVTGSNNGIAGARLAARLRSRSLRGTS